MTSVFPHFFVKDGKMEPKEYPQMVNENPVTEDEISKIVSKKKNNKTAGQVKVFVEMVKYDNRIVYQKIAEILQQISAGLHKSKL